MSDSFRETLYTVDSHGHRKWVYPNLIKGTWFKRRNIIAYFLIAFYLCMPWIEIGGKQAVWIDIFHRKFTFFGTTFWATDTIFLFLTFGLLALSLFFFTALFGRVWCGWACPETVFLEFVFRPIERLIEGSGAQRLRLDMQPWNKTKIIKKGLKHILCAAIAWIIATTALAYVLGAQPLITMIIEGPLLHITPFIMTIVGMGLMAFQFGWFREQFCTVLCPYARFQSVLMDQNSLVVGYDPVRGEPRGKVRKGETPHNELGDCIDCGLCVRVCPTGIDIRNGLQLECIACTACIDACDSVMKQIERPSGLIRYDSENNLTGKNSKILRPRVFVYATILLLLLGSFSILLAKRELSEFQVLRGSQDSPYTLLGDGRISNHLHLRIINKSEDQRAYSASIQEPGYEVLMPGSPFPVKAASVATVPIFINFEQNKLASANHSVTVILRDSSGFEGKEVIRVLGPDKSE